MPNSTNPSNNASATKPAVCDGCSETIRNMKLAVHRNILFHSYLFCSEKCCFENEREMRKAYMLATTR